MRFHGKEKADFNISKAARNGKAGFTGSHLFILLSRKANFRKLRFVFNGLIFNAKNSNQARGRVSSCFFDPDPGVIRFDLYGAQAF